MDYYPHFINITFFAFYNNNYGSSRYFTLLSDIFTLLTSYITAICDHCDIEISAMSQRAEAFRSKGANISSRQR